MLMKLAARRVRPGVLALCAAASLVGCKSVDLVPQVPGVTPYRMTVQQGNYLSQEMVAQLKPGMTREQVRFVLGTPLVADIFHADRWDYVFYRELPNGKREQRNLSVIFEKDKLARVVGDLLPADGAAPQATGFAPQVKPDAPAKPAAEAAKPAAEPPKAAGAPPKPAAEAPRPLEEAAPTKQNWRTAGDEPEAKPDAKPDPKPEPAPVAKEDENKPADAPEEKGFFGRMLEKIGL